jgi:dihydrofolate synthase/folylpolyglutamate synthase
MRRLVPELPLRAGEPTTFEVTTALALDYFARAECDVAVVEVGLGGRLDATNAIDPYLSVITSISYDHTAILGHRLGAIAAEKAGILRAGRCALLAAQRPAVMKALQRACRDVGAQCRVVRPVERTIPLAGAHQWQNAALAIAAARVLVPKITDGSIQRGLQRLRWPGRFEIIGEAPPVVLDGAHNGASAEALANTLEHYTAGRPLDLVVGINRDKDARAVLRPLVGLAQRVWATQTANNVRALPANELARLCRSLGAPAESVPDVEAALDQAMRNTSGVVCVTGSLMLVGQARATLGVPAPEQLW